MGPKPSSAMVMPETLGTANLMFSFTLDTVEHCIGGFPARDGCKAVLTSRLSEPHRPCFNIQVEIPILPVPHSTRQNTKHRMLIDFDGFSCHDVKRTMVLDELTIKEIAEERMLPRAAISRPEIMELLSQNELYGIALHFFTIKSTAVFDPVEPTTDRARQVQAALRKLCNIQQPPSLYLYLKGSKILPKLTKIFKWLKGYPAIARHPISGYRHTNGRLLIQDRQLKKLAEVSNTVVPVALASFWDMEEFLAHMTYQAAREHEYIVNLRQKLSEFGAKMTVDPVPNRPGLYIAHFAAQQQEVVAQLISTGDKFMVHATGEDDRDYSYSCTCGPPLRNDQGWNLSAVLSVSNKGRSAQEYLSDLQALPMAVANVTMAVQENDRIYRSRIDAFARFQTMYEGCVADATEDSVRRARGLGNFLLGREQRPQQCHGLFNLRADRRQALDRSLASLNVGQRAAFDSVANASQPIVFVQGPPGTGKTFLIVKIAEAAVIAGKTVILAAPTNTAANVLATRIHEALPREILYRYFPKQEEISRLERHGGVNTGDPNPMGFRPNPPTADADASQPETSDSDATTQAQPWDSNSTGSGLETASANDSSYLEPYLLWLRELLKTKEMSQPMELSIHVAVLKLIQEETHPLAKEFLVAQRSRDLKFCLDKWFEKALKELFARARFVVTTTSNASDRALWTNFPADIGIIDEGGNAVEPETMTIMTNFLTSVRVWVVAGDHSQLPPFVASSDKMIGERAANPFAAQMRQSLMERVAVRGYPTSFLSEQRRSVAGLMWPVSQIFYQGRLTDGPGTALMLRPHARAALGFLQPYFPVKLNCPLVFWHVQTGKCRRDVSSPSRYNLEDATAVVKLVQAYLGSVAGADPRMITIITPYRRQNAVIRELLMEGGAQNNSSSRLGPLQFAGTPIRVHGFNRMRVETADSAQGHENSLVILNLVVTVHARRNGGVGHVAERNRLCVATSRAQNCMMVIGDFGLWRELGADQLGHYRDKSLHKFLGHFNRTRTVANFPF